MTMPIVPGAAPPGVMPLRVLLDEAMRLLRAHFRRLYPPFAAVLVAYGGLSVVLQLGWIEGLTSGDLASGCASLAGLFAVSALAGLAYAAMQVAALDAVAGRPVAVGRAFRFILRTRVFVTLVGTGVLVIGAYFCCLLPVLYVWPLLSLTLPVMVEEGRTGADAIARGARLVGPDPFDHFPRNPLVKLLVFMAVAMAISLLGSLLVQLPFEIARQILFLRQAAAEEALSALTSPGAVALQAAGVVLGSLVTTMVGLYMMFGIALLFHDTRNRREGADLEAAAAALAALRPPAPAGGEGGA
jgi:hypothetical protein